jgi:hypothetical protein
MVERRRLARAVPAIPGREAPREALPKATGAEAADWDTERVTKTLLYAGIAVLAVADVVWSIIEHRRGWRGGHFSRGLTRYRPSYNAKTGQRGGPPAEGPAPASEHRGLPRDRLALLGWANGS